MGIFKCPKCGYLRNNFDRLSNGQCRTCGGGGVARPQPRLPNPFSLKDPKNVTKYPCHSCKKWVGPNTGRMFKNGITFCDDCLNSGRWLNYYRRKGVKTVESLEWNKGAHFGR